METLTIDQNQIDFKSIIKKEIFTIDKEHILSNNSSLICKISTKNTIKFCNIDFIKNSGFSEKELLNNSLDLIKHPEMPKIVSNFIESIINKGSSISCVVKNKTKDGRYFWSYATFTPKQDGNFKIAYSIKSKAISYKAKIRISKLYDCLYSLESKINEETALRYLIGFLEEKCMSLTEYTKYLLSLK